MLKYFNKMLALITLFSALSFAGESPTLTIGSKAPAFEAEWLKGTPVKRFEEGKIYVLEFWATWCGPCRASIPHMSELARETKNENVTIIGVAARERGRSLAEKRELVTNFLTNEKNPKFEYSVAFDGSAKTNDEWLSAANAPGIPFAVIVDGKGQIVFMGHPLEMIEEKVLQRVIAGTWEADGLAAHKKKAEDAAAESIIIDAAMRAISSAFNKHDDNGAIKACDDAIAKLSEESAEQFVIAKIMILISNSRANEADTFARALTKSSNNVNTLSRVFDALYNDADIRLASDEGGVAMANKIESLTSAPGVNRTYKAYLYISLTNYNIHKKNLDKAEEFLAIAEKANAGNDKFADEIKGLQDKIRELKKTP